MTIPNLITVARFIMVPGVVYAMMLSEWRIALGLFVLAGLSDGVDGFIARRFDQRSKIGAYLDPVADKLLVVSVFVMLAIIGALPDWLVVLVVSRDILIVGAVLLAGVVGQPLEMRPLLVSKANTAAQILLLAATLFGLAFPPAFTALQIVLVAAVATLTIASGGAYLVTWLRHVAGFAD